MQLEAPPAYLPISAISSPREERQFWGGEVCNGYLSLGLSQLWYGALASRVEVLMHIHTHGGGVSWVVSGLTRCFRTPLGGVWFCLYSGRTGWIPRIWDCFGRLLLLLLVTKQDRHTKKETGFEIPLRNFFMRECKRNYNQKKLAQVPLLPTYQVL